MNKTRLSIFFVAVLFLGCTQKDTPAQTPPGQSQRADGQSFETERIDDPARLARIQANIEFNLRSQLQGQSVSVGSISRSVLEGFDTGTFSIDQQTYRFLTSRDDKQFFILAAGPFDASKTSEEIAETLSEEQRQAAVEARIRSDVLDEAISGMPLRGNPEAPVTLVEFSDFQCPYCRRGSEIVEELLQQYGDDIRFVYMHFPLDFHPWAHPSAVAAACAAQQDGQAFWTLHDTYFRSQEEITPENVAEKSRGYLATTGIDLNAWSVCLNDEESVAHQGAQITVQASMDLGQRFGVTGTPGFFINGTFINGAQPMETFHAAIEEALRDG